MFALCGCDILREFSCCNWLDPWKMHTCGWFFLSSYITFIQWIFVCVGRVFFCKYSFAPFIVCFLFCLENSIVMSHWFSFFFLFTAIRFYLFFYIFVLEELSPKPFNYIICLVEMLSEGHTRCIMIRCIKIIYIADIN